MGHALEDIRQIVEKSPVPLAGGDGNGKPQFEEGLVLFNGVNDDGHETFAFPTASDHRRDEDDIFSFCKTAYKPYDVVVVACLAAAKDRLGDNIKVSSDGDRPDWDEGVALASEALGREIANPITDEE